jgi:hypothetical protein
MRPSVAAIHQPPGTEAPRRLRPRLRYELIGCRIHGHELVGTDAEYIDDVDRLVVRVYDDLRWYRCLRCDSWLPLPAPSRTARDRLPGLDQIAIPLRGKPLRDRFVLRLIALDRVVHVLVLSTMAAAIFLFAKDRGALHHAYVRILGDLQGGVGGPMFDTQRGIFPEINRLFSFSATKLYFIGTAVAAYAALLIVEAVGLWEPDVGPSTSPSSRQGFSCRSRSTS